MTSPCLAPLRSSRRLSRFVLLCSLIFLNLCMWDRARAEPATEAEIILVASTFGVAGREGADINYRCRGTAGQPLPGGFWGGSGKVLWGGFWTLLYQKGDLPIPVRLSYFTATRIGNGALIRWAAQEASDHLGFHVYRQVGAGDREQLTMQMLYGRTEYEYEDSACPDVEVSYWLAEVGRSGSIEWFGPVIVQPGSAIPQAVSLSPPFPNPLVATSAIPFSLPHAAAVRVDVFDISGRWVATLVNETKDAGQHRVEWNGNGRGAHLPAGIYVIKLQAGNETRTQKLVLAR